MLHNDLWTDHFTYTADHFIYTADHLKYCSIAFAIGVLIRVTPSGGVGRTRFGSGTFRDSYQGYAVTAGRFLDRDTQDFAVSVPKLETYFGRVR